MFSHIKIWNDFDFVLEETDPSETYTGFALSDKDDMLYYGKINALKSKLTVQQAVATLHPIADSKIFAKLPNSSSAEKVTLYIAKDRAHTDEDVYIKRPRLTNYGMFQENSVARLIGGELIDEALSMELFSRHPHPSIIRYHGCRSRDGYLTNIVLDRRADTLDEYINHSPNALSIFTFMEKLESAVQHIHGLGWAHNDINPGNIMVDDSNAPEVAPVSIDFGSAKRIGEPLGNSRGTGGWYERPIEEYKTSLAEHDTFALEKIRSWLKESLSRAKN